MGDGKLHDIGCTVDVAIDRHADRIDTDILGLAACILGLPETFALAALNDGDHANEDEQKSDQDDHQRQTADNQGHPSPEEHVGHGFSRIGRGRDVEYRVMAFLASVIK
ncbi:hypothetical protein D3C73_948810 [compost metagenome]